MRQTRQRMTRVSPQLAAARVPHERVPQVVTEGTGDTLRMLCLLLDFTHPPPYLPSLGTVLLSVLLAATAATVL